MSDLDHFRPHGYTKLDNDLPGQIIRDTNDFVALAIYIHLATCPSGWSVSAKALSRMAKQGTQVISKALAELRSTGWLVLVKYQAPGGLWQSQYVVMHDSPMSRELLPEFLAQMRTKLGASARVELSTAAPTAPEPASPEPGNPGSGLTRANAPEHGKPGSGEPDSGNPGSIRNKSLTNLPPTPHEPVAAPEAPPPEEKGKNRFTPDRPPQPRAARHPDPPQQPAKPEPEPDLPQSPSAPPGQVSQHARSIVDACQRAWATRLGRRHVAQLCAAIDQALAEGSSPSVIREHLCRNTSGAHSPGRVLLARMENLPAEEPLRSVPVWCGACESSEHRYVETDTGRWVRCPHCHPGAGYHDDVDDPKTWPAALMLGVS